MWHYIQQQLDEPLTAGEIDTLFSTSGAINSTSWRCQTQQEKDASFTARTKLLTLAISTIYSSNLQKEHQFFTAAKGSSFTAGETYTI
jgi:hypothetical protein